MLSFVLKGFKTYNMKPAIIFIYIFFLINSALSAQSSIASLTQALRVSYENSDIPGIAVAIVNKDSLLYQEEFGYADIASKKPYTQQTIHNIGSTSKTLIGIAIMQLVEKGQLSLDTKINTILPFKVNNPYHPNTPITIRHLATHTASINDRVFNYDLKSYVSKDATRSKRKGLPLIYRIQFKQMQRNEDLSLGTYLEKVLSKKGNWYKKKNFLKDAPGTKEAYSNIGSALAAYIVEVVTGIPYDEYTQKNILTPLGMNASVWSYEASNKQHFASRYIKDKAVPNYQLITYPDGGLISSCADLTTYAQAMLSGYFGESDLLTPASFKILMGNQFEQAPLNKTLKNPAGRSGIFWDIFGKQGIGDIGHSGSDPGVVSFLYFHPTTGIACVLTANLDAHKKFDQIVEIWQILIDYRNEIIIDC